MKLQLIAAALAATFMVGCTKCSQQPTTETAPEAAPAVEAAPAPVEPEAVPVEGATAEGMPATEEMNEELPPAEPEAK